MYMDRQEFERIVRKHNTLLVLDSDVDEALEFVQELLYAESDAMKKECPYATKTIDKMEYVAHQIFAIRSEIEEESK